MTIRRFLSRHHIIMITDESLIADLWSSSVQYISLLYYVQFPFPYPRALARAFIPIRFTRRVSTEYLQIIIDCVERRLIIRSRC